MPRENRVNEFDIKILKQMIIQGKVIICCEQRPFNK